MHRNSSLVRRYSYARRSSLVLTLAALSAAPALAADGTWTNTLGGTYSDSTNWLGGVVAMGADATANFNTLDIAGVVPVTLTADPILGSLIFGDTDVSTPGGWQLSGTALTLAGTAPTITTNALAAGSTARIDNVLLGTNGLTLTGAGTTHLTAGNLYTGTTTLNGANVLLGAGSAFQPNQFGVAGSNLVLNGVSTINNGSSASGTMFIGNNIVANAGSTTTFNLGSRSQIGQSGAGNGRQVTGSGNLIFNLQSQASRNDFQAGFGGFTGNVTFTGQQYTTTAGTFSPVGRFLINVTGGTAFGTGFTNAAVTLSDFAVLTTRTNGAGNVINLGSLSGTSNTAGFIAPEAGGAATYSIGGLNTSTSFAGLFVGNNIVQKVGTGTLTLTSAQFHTNNTNINAGTLALAGDANLATSPLVNIANGATFNVAGTNTTYGTAAGQTLSTAAGSTTTIVGNYNQSQGTFNPGTITGAGRVNFNGNLTLDGGVLNLELSTNPAPGGTNDLISVTGSTNLGGGLTLNLGILGGLGTGTYTLLESSNPITGSTAGWAVNFGGRGAAPAIIQNSNSLQVNLSSVSGAALVFTGAAGNGNFDINTTQNFTNAGTPDKFFQLDSVRFDDTSAIKTVTLIGGLSPSALVVDNTAAYTFNGAGSINGGGSLIKRGTGTLTIANTTANTFTGGTIIEGGLVDTGTLGVNPLGTGPITFAGGNLRSLTPSGTNTTLVNPIVVNATGSFITGNTTSLRTTVLSGPITGSGTLNIVNENTALAKGVDLGDTGGFAGNLNVGTALTVRFSNATTNGNAGLGLDIAAGGTVGTISPNALVIPLRSLTGAGRLQGHSSTGSGSTVEYQIGGVNSSSTFDGTIANGSTGTGGVTPLPVLITKVGTGTVTLTGPNVYTGASTVKAGTLALGANATGPVLGNATVTAPGGADIQGGLLKLGYVAGSSPASQVRSILVSGFQLTPKFSSGQIRSTTLTAGRTLGYRDDVASSTVLIGYTLPGDANVNFTVGFEDLVPLAQNYGLGNKVWEQGDFDYDSDIDFDDLVLLAQNYGGSALTDGQLASLGGEVAGDWALAQALVPEPTSLAAAAGLATLVLRRRRASIA